MKSLISAQVILAIATFAFYVSGYDECVIVGLASTQIKDIEADADLIIAQATEEEEFICEYENGSTAALDLEGSQSSILSAMLSDGDLVSGHDMILVEPVVGRDEVKGGGGKEEKKVKIGAGLSIFEAIKKEPSSSNRRLMASLTGNKYIVVVIGDATDHAFNPSKYTSYEGIDAKATAVSEDVFGGGSDVVNMKSQFDACSFGKLQIIPEPDPAWINEASSQTFSAADLSEVESAPGVVTVSLDVLIEGASESEIRNEFLNQAISKMDVDGSKGLVFPGPFDHVIYARHACYGGDCGWAAYAYINSWNQMFQGSYIGYVGVLIHEMGHNLNLAHSGSEGFQSNPNMSGDSNGYITSGGYTDHTCMMGNPLYSDEVGKMCFNAAKNFQIDGWYNDAKLIIDPVNDGTWTGNIIGIGEYNERDDEPVTVKIETGTETDYFVGFNRAIGPNSQNDLGDNMVNIIRAGNNGEAYSQSYLDMLLDATSAYSEYNIPNFAGTTNSLMIKVNSINTSVVPAYASVTISLAFPTTAPINPPTSAWPVSAPINPPTSAWPVSAPINPPTSAWPVSAPINPPTSAWPVSAPINPPVSAPVDDPTGSCRAGEAYVKLTISTDYWGYETSWEFLSGGSTIMSRVKGFYGNSRTYDEDIGCVSKSAEHTLIIKDSYGDGIYYGSYELNVDDQVMFSGSNFGYEATNVIPANFNIFVLDLETDNYGGETSWDLMDSMENVIQSKNIYSYSSGKTYKEMAIIGSGCHTFTIRDSWGDGICCTWGQGSYKVEYNGDLVVNGGAFGSSESTTFPDPDSCQASPAETNEINSNVDNKSAKVSAYLEGEEMFLEEIDQMLNERVIPGVKAEKDKGKTKGVEKNKV